MKKSTLLILLLFLFCGAQAQFKVLAEGPVFEEPKEGFAKLLNMKNGNTAFIHISIKKGIFVNLYNTAYQQTATINFEPAYGKLTHGSIEGAFEIGGDIVLMISEFTDRTPVLYRLIIDGRTGTLKEEKKIAELNRVGFFQGYAAVFGDVPIPDFFVRKDPASDNYALVMFNSFESERSKRIEIVTYGADNKELARAYYASPQERYKYMQYVDMAVIGSDKVCVLAYAYNTRNSGGKESELILANLEKGATKVSFNELGFSKDLMVYSGITRYSPATKSLILAANTKSKSNDKGYIPILAFVNPFENKLNRVNVISPSDRLNQFSKKGFTGLPQNLFVNDDGTFTVVSEEMTINTTSGSYGTSVSTILGDMAIVNYSKTGEFINDYLIRKSHQLNGFKLAPYYHSVREGTAQALAGGNQFKSFAYLNGTTRNFILFNDTERNNDAQESGSLVNIQGVSGTDGFYYPLTGPNAVPKRYYVFGNAEKRDHIFALFTISDYDRKNNVYTTLKLENQGGKKGVRVAWLRP